MALFVPSGSFVIPLYLFSERLLGIKTVRPFYLVGTETLYGVNENKNLKKITSARTRAAWVNAPPLCHWAINALIDACQITIALSTGNFAASGGGGGCAAPRSAPSTPLQLDNHPRSKHDKHAVKPLSGSAPSVRTSTISQAANDSAEGSKQPSKARQKKFQRHFPQVGPEERVLNYYSCALVGDLLLQGHLYITKNYFAFYSNVFGYVTKLLIPITSVLRITKEKVARIIPNAVGVCTRDERHVFGSLLSRDATYKLMTHVWKASRVPELAAPKPNQELRASEVELDASEYSPYDDSSSGGGEPHEPHEPRELPKQAEAIITTAIHKTGAAVIQPALLTGGTSPRRTPGGWQALLLFLVFLLTASAVILAYRLQHSHQQEDLLKLSGEELYLELVRWRTRLHGRAASELHSFLSTNLLLLTKVRQSLEALSGVILTDMSAGAAPYNVDLPSDAFS
ncbi:GRAM domain-containing protein [Phthorimaea operculella]|nr:GRAM domain-containing protein [Phthorimaea operculella]